MKKIIFPLFWLVVLISLWRLFSYETFDSEEVSFPLSYNPEESTTIVLQNKHLFLLHLPKTESFNYVMLKLVGEQDALPMKKCRNARKEAYDVIFNLHDVPNGYYFIEIYTAPKKYTTYLSYIRGQTLRIQVNDSSIDFIEPPTLAKNQEAFAANQQDDAALDYYLRPSIKIQSDDPMIIEHAGIIIAGLSTDYEKLKAIHDWVSSNIWYDYDALNAGIPSNQSSIETLVSQKGVCIDYASLTAALLRSVGIPTKMTVGYVLNTSANEIWTEELISSNQINHVWNEAYVDGRWVIIDTTYDSSNTYKNGVFSSGTSMKNRKYFDITIDFLSTNRYIVPIELE